MFGCVMSNVFFRKIQIYLLYICIEKTRPADDFQERSTSTQFLDICQPSLCKNYLRCIFVCQNLIPSILDGPCVKFIAPFNSNSPPGKAQVDLDQF
jgi:hypothetical protein